MKVYTPDGEVGQPDVAPAPSPSVLTGRRIGILDNRKPNAHHLLGRLAERLAERTGAEVAVIESKNAALAAPEEVLGRLTKEVQLVLTGSAD